MRKPSPAESKKNVFTQYKIVAFSCGMGILAAFAILALCAGVMSSIDIPHGAVIPMSILAMVMGCLLAGFLCARMVGSGGLLCGLVCATVIFLLGIAAELFVAGGQVGILALYKYIACASSAMIGGVLGVNKRRKVR